jgi:siderophore synthetase component
VIRRCSSFRTFPGFGVLLECGYRTLIPRCPEEEALVESWTVLFREHPFSAGEVGPVVVASLLEEPVGLEQPTLLRAVLRAGGESEGTVSGSTAYRWLRRYLEISLKPLLWVFIREGVSLEAHVQNAMVRLEKGWPERFYVRDMEGVSIGRERAEATGFYGGVLSPESPVLYPEEEAWNRLKYYFVTNHLGHLIHVLARYGGRDERELWRIVRKSLEDWKELRQEKRGERFVQDLLDNPRLPAKANLISRFREQGECPSYVTVANPLCEVSP